LDVIRPPESPQGLQVSTQPEALALTWDPVPKAQTYRVERRDPGGEDYWERAEVNETSFRDLEFAWEQSYSYRVVSMARSATGVVEGGLSKVETITPRDVFPPPPPAGLRAVAAGDRVELAWEAQLGTDVKGYRVRRAEGPDEPRLLHHDLLASPRYTDLQIESGRTYRYRVTVLDQASNESAAAEAEALVP
jgi:fibronectin type 3 domain-containing protein